MSGAHEHGETDKRLTDKGGKRGRRAKGRQREARGEKKARV